MARRLRLRFRLHTVPGRIRTLTACAVVALAGLFAVTAVAVWQARDGLRTIGNRDGRTVIATADLYSALTDMDLQVTDVLLTGQEAGWLCEPEATGQDQTGEGETPAADTTCDRAPARVLYEIRREDAQQAALEAAQLADDDPVRLETVQTVLDGLHQYDQHVQAAMQFGGQAGHPLGAPPSNAVVPYRFATALMTEELLPSAYNLTLDGQARVNSTYEDRRDAAAAGRIQVAAAGLIAIGLLVALQMYLGMRFRRVLNPALAVAAVGALAFTVAGTTLLATEADYLRVAKAGGFDQVLALTRAQAIGTSMDADRGRSLLDPGNADRYDQMYLDKAQALLSLPVTNLAGYDARLAASLDRYGDDSHAAGFGGFYGAEARAVGVHADGARAERELLGTLLARYGRYQRTDRHIRDLAAAGRRTEAAQAHMDPATPTLPHPDFQAYDDGLTALITHHQYLTDRTVQNGDQATTAWTWLLPASFAVIVALIVAGVRPRLNEYR
jgi:hypothetical protein